MQYTLPVNIHSSDSTLLGQDYLYLFHKSDAFSRRLLSTNLIVDSQYKYQLKVESFEYHPSTGRKINLFLAGDLPINLVQGIKYLRRIKKLGNRVKHDYGRYKTDIEKNIMLIKQENSIIRTTIHVLDLDKFDQEASVPEKAMVELYQITDDWIEKIYTSYKTL